MEEEFRTCIENNNYSVSNFGRLRNNKTNKILKGSKNSDGYMIFDYTLDGIRHFKLIHRLVALAFIPNPDEKPFIDHIDNNKTNNNAYNLRWCTSNENQQNIGLKSNNTSGHKGVFYRKDSKKWRATISHNGKIINLGSFKTKEEAMYERKKKANELFGLFVHSIEKLEEVIVELKMEALKIDTD
jgi:hypothetical protein